MCPPDGTLQVERQLPGPAGKLQQLHAEGRLAQATPEALGLHDEEGGGGGAPLLSQVRAAQLPMETDADQPASSAWAAGKSHVPATASSRPAPS